jgi:hypothetical protein
MMVARVIRTAGLSVSFWRDGEEIEIAIAATGRDALKAALLMLARLDELQDGDRLQVTEG